MTTAGERTIVSTTSLLPGAVVIARIRRLLYVGIVSGVLYSMFTTAAKGGCPGGVDASGGFVDANGNPTDVPPDCITLTLGPSPLILIFLAGAMLWALGRVLRRADSEASALRILDGTATVIVLVAAMSFVVAQVWFALIPLDGINGSGTYLWPFPFGSGNLQTAPMPMPTP